MDNEVGNITKCVIHAHGEYTAFKSFEVPKNIRLVLSTITSYSVTDNIHGFLKLLHEKPTIFVDTQDGLAITKEGIQFQEKLRKKQRAMRVGRKSRTDHRFLTMFRLIGVKTGTKIRDINLSFTESEKGEYYYPGIYVNSEDGCKF